MAWSVVPDEGGDNDRAQEGIGGSAIQSGGLNFENCPISAALRQTLERVSSCRPEGSELVPSSSVREQELLGSS